MGADRQVWLTDRWGVQWDEGVTLERFAELFGDLDADDDEHCAVAINDEHEWYVEFSLTTVTFGNAEAGADEGTVTPADRADALAIAAEFLSGDLETLRRRPWA